MANDPPPESHVSRIVIGLSAAPVHGWLEDENGERQTFHGLLELVALLDALVQRQSARGHRA